jgi:hypothetical protein
MNNKQAFLTILGGMIFAVFGGVLLFLPIGLPLRDGGDDGFGMLWILLSVLFGIVGLFLSSMWSRKHSGDDVNST